MILFDPKANLDCLSYHFVQAFGKPVRGGECFTHPPPGRRSLGGHGIAAGLHHILRRGGPRDEEGLRFTHDPHEMNEVIMGLAVYG
jgi:hypothetical protein